MPHRISAAILLAASVSAAACANHLAHHTQLAQTQATIGAAAALQPRAGTPAAEALARAEALAHQAQQQLQQGEAREAHLALLRAEADARLALALGHEAPARARAQDSEDHVQALHEAATDVLVTPAALEEHRLPHPTGAPP